MWKKKKIVKIIVFSLDLSSTNRLYDFDSTKFRFWISKPFSFAASGILKWASIYWTMSNCLKANITHQCTNAHTQYNSTESYRQMSTDTSLLSTLLSFFSPIHNTSSHTHTQTIIFFNSIISIRIAHSFDAGLYMCNVFNTLHSMKWVELERYRHFHLL